MDCGRWIAWIDEPEANVARRNLFVQGWTGFALSLFAVTWRLWLPQQRFPQVPFFPIPGEVPRAIEGLLFFGMLLALGASFLLVQRRLGRYFLGVFALCLAASMGLDQQRVQPWAYQFLILSLILAANSSRQAWWMARSLAISVYLYSACSKFDYQFIVTLGPDFFQPLLTLGGAIELPAGRELLSKGAWLFPLGELLIGLALLFPRTRRLGLYAAIGMHLSLIWILGPWGLNHKPGVLLWNLFFVFQAWILFGPFRPGNSVPSVELKPPYDFPPRGGLARNLSVSVWGAALLLPMTSLWGWYDHWPSWELYAPRTSRVKVELSPALQGKLPEELRPFWNNERPEGVDDLGWREFDLAAWSLDALQVPIYPQGRFQLGVALALALELEEDRDIRVTLQSPADRWTGARKTQQWIGRQAIEQAMDQFQINARPRPFSTEE
jgi:hypothetical protein